MKGVIVNFRGSHHRQHTKQMIVHVHGVDNKEKATHLIGKTVVFKTPGANEIKGKVSLPHGRNGAVRVIFEKGMPGQSLAKEVTLQ